MKIIRFFVFMFYFFVGFVSEIIKIIWETIKPSKKR